MKTPVEYIKEITHWSLSHDSVQAAALVGSYARNKAKPDSDIDIVILSRDKAKFLNDISWMSQFGEVEKSSREEWGIVTSIRAFYRDGQEIEFGIAPLSWAEIPVDAGTRRVVSDGMIILKDNDNLLKKLKNSIQHKRAG